MVPCLQEGQREGIDAGDFGQQVIPSKNKTDGLLPFMLPSTWIPQLKLQSLLSEV